MDKLTDILLCVGCQEKYDKREMMEGKDRILYCGDCFKNIYSEDFGHSKTIVSNPMCEKLIPFPEIFSYNKMQSSCLNRNTSTMSLSKRPLQCPKANCNKFVSLFTLESHFKYEHKEIPIILTQLDARSALEFYPRDIAFNLTQCIVLLNVINYDFSHIFPQTSSSKFCNRDSRPGMVLLATKISNHDLEQFEKLVTSSRHSVNSVRSDSTLTFRQESYILRPQDKIIIWLASNVLTNLSYTVAASTLCNKIRQKYFGPIPTLDDSCLHLCRMGTCLTLSHYHINGMTENGIKPLTIDIVVHSPD